AFAYYAIGGGTVVPRAAATSWRLAIFLVAVIGIAGFGHFITDAFDVIEDRLNGRANAWDRLTVRQRTAVAAGLLLAAWLPWLVLPIGSVGVALLMTEFALFALYAMPP